jgi:hypothetical protein
MSIREKLADWISGGALTFHKNGWTRSSALYDEAKAIGKALEADVFEWNGKAIKAQIARDEAVKETARMVQMRDSYMGQNANYDYALRAILTARNITEARKIAREALGEAE